jgi:regulator of sirC expression with transglutaminase-like and TPR domain
VTSGTSDPSGALAPSGSSEPSDPSDPPGTSEPSDPPATRPAPSDRAANQARARELYNRGVRSFVEGKTTDARRAFRDAIRLDPGYAPAHRGLGLAYERSGEKRAAVKELEKYLRLAPGARDAASVRKRIERLGG